MTNPCITTRLNNPTAGPAPVLNNEDVLHEAVALLALTPPGLNPEVGDYPVSQMDGSEWLDRVPCITANDVKWMVTTNQNLAQNQDQVTSFLTQSQFLINLWI